jgi:VWFA-related protein
MKRLILPLILLLSFIATGPTALMPTASQTRERVVTQAKGDVIKVDVDLVTLDALVMQQKTGRIVGDLKREDFVLSEDGVKQQIAHFSQDTLPLSVLLLIDRGGCLDPFGSKVRQAALDAISRLKPTDEVALMAYHDTVQLIQEFTPDRKRIAEALDRVPPHDEEAEHCLNRAFYEAAQYMIRAGNPVGRRVIIAITGVTSNFDCPGPSGVEATHAVLESGSVVCGLIPRSPGQRMESGVNKLATSVAGVFKVHSLSINKLAEETGGEVLDDKPENLDQAFNTLVGHLRTRYSMGFVSSNKKHDGSLRKLKLEISQPRQKAEAKAGKLVVRTRRGYIAPKK